MQKAEVIQRYLEKYALIENKVVNEAVMQVYFEALGHYSVRQIEKGMKKYLKEGERWAWPGTLAGYISEEI